MKNHLDSRPWTWLFLGALLLVASQVRLGLGVLAWIAPVPFLHYLRVTEGWRSRAAFSAVSFVAWFAGMLKIMTAPLPAIAALGWAGPLSVLLVLPYFGWSWVRQRLGENAAMLGFGTMMVVAFEHGDAFVLAYSHVEPRDADGPHFRIEGLDAEDWQQASLQVAPQWWIRPSAYPKGWLRLDDRYDVETMWHYEEYD